MTAHSRSVEVSSCTRGSSAGITISFCLKRTDTGSLHSRGIVCDFPDDIMILRTQTWGWGWGWLVLKPSKTCPFRGALASFITSRIWEERPSLTHHSSQNELCLQWNGYGVQPLLSFFCFVLLCFLVFLVVLFFFFWLHPIARGTSAPGPGTEPGPWQWKWRILTTGCCCLVTNSCLTLATPWTAALQASLRFTNVFSCHA